MLEIWRTAVYDGEIYEGLYKVSNLGKILSLNYKRTGRAELMTPVENGYGYLMVGLYKNRKRKWCLVHRLVAETFLNNPEGKPEINHIDEDKTNNFIFLNKDGSVDKEKSNLDWCWCKDNCNHGTRNERIVKANTNGKLSKRVLQFTLDGHLIREWESIRECGRNGFNSCNVARCCKGKLKTHKGFKWKYKGEE